MNCNLRTQFERLIRRVGLTPWPRLMHNLRASRETELAAEFPLHVVTRWLGNTPKIAMKHYLQVTEDDFAKATGRDGKSPNGSEPPTPDPEPATRSEDPTPKGESPAKPSRTGQHPGERQPSDRGGSAPGQGGSPGSDRGRGEDRRRQRAAECGAVAVQNAVQSAHAGDCRESTAQSETPVVAGVCANPDQRSQPSSRDRNGGDRIRTCDLEVMSLASYRTAPPRVAEGDVNDIRHPLVASSVFYPSFRLGSRATPRFLAARLAGRILTMQGRRRFATSNSLARSDRPELRPMKGIIGGREGEICWRIATGWLGPRARCRGDCSLRKFPCGKEFQVAAFSESWQTRDGTAIINFLVGLVASCLLGRPPIEGSCWTTIR